MSSFTLKLEEARRRLPLKTLMDQRGKGAREGKWKPMPHCPYCNRKGSASVSEKDGRQWFKCFGSDCPSGTAPKKAAWDEIGFLAHELNLSRKDAATTYLKEAGVWESQERLAPSVMPGKAGRKRPPLEPTREEIAAPSDTLPTANSEVPGTSEPSPDSFGKAEPVAPLSPHEAGTPRESQSAGGAAAVPPASRSSADEAIVAPAGDPTELPPHPDPSSSTEATGATTTFPDSAMPDGVEEGSATRPEGADAAPPTTDESAESELPPGGGGGGSGGGDGGGNDEEPHDRSPLTALRWFYARLSLTEADRELLWAKRGLVPSTVAAAGLRSNVAANKELLLAMKDKFPVATLLDAGLFVPGERPGDEPKPNAQFYGYGIKGKKVLPEGERKKKRSRWEEDEEDRDKWEWGWTNPILIPYFDERGEVVHLRPHKGMMRDKSPRVFHARRWAGSWRTAGSQTQTSSEAPESVVPVDFGGEVPVDDDHHQLPPRADYAVITEGEFKALALWQVLGFEECVVAALPGITLAKPLFAEIEEWVLEANVPQTVVAYDNEEKGDPNLPGYKEDKWDRYDTEVWSRYLCRRLAKEGLDARLARLPESWRDEKGKADWDGALARLIPQMWTKVRQIKEPALPGVGHSAEEIWAAVATRVKTEFVAVLRKAVKIEGAWQAGFFDSEEERIIRNKLERIAYVPKLPAGGDHEIAVARRLQRLAAKLRVNGNADRLPPKARGMLGLMARHYQDLKGGYYIFKPLSEKVHDQWVEFLGEASEREDLEVRRACEIVLQGIPQRISDFQMRAHYVLRRLDGTRERIVTLHNIHGVSSRLVELPSDAFAQPSQFRKWLLNKITGATWEAGEREMNKLQADVARDVAYKDVGQVAVRGYHAESKLWFFTDVTYAPDGQELFADRHGVIWFEGQGYKLSDFDHEGQTFKQGQPEMRPQEPADLKTIQTLFQEASQKLYDTVGGYGGYLALGAMLACIAGPEIYGRWTGFPGLWLHGETNQGKSSVAKWLIRLFGFRKETGMPLPDSTKVGVGILLQQYGNLMAWLEEYQTDCPKWMQEKIKEIYNRESGGKKTFGEGDRRIIGSAIVTGVATSPDPQVRSRYCHVHVSERNRLQNHYDWFEENSGRFFLLGRYLLRNRKEFAALTLDQMRHWMEMDKSARFDTRSRIVHGAAYGAFRATVAMLESHSAQQMHGFVEYLVDHCREMGDVVREQVNVNQFWTDTMAALAANAFGVTVAERRRIFNAIEKKKDFPPLSPHQLKVGEESAYTRWRGYYLYLRPDPVIDMMRKYKRQQGQELALSKSDLRAQMQTRPYWVKAKGDCHRQKFLGSTLGCWCIDLDKFEGMGYRAVSDEEFNASLYSDGEPEQGNFLAREDWNDPRRGDLYALVESLKAEKGEKG